MSALKNLTSLRRSITKRIREALQELQENLGNLGESLERSPIPVRVPVPLRSKAPFRGPIPRSYYGVSSGCNGLHGWSTSGIFHNQRGFQFMSSRFFTTYNKFGGFNSWRWAPINQSVIFHNFSSKSQFRLKLFDRFYKTPSLTQLLKKKSGFHDEEATVSGGSRFVAKPRRSKTIPTALRLNHLLTQKFHDMVLTLAKPFSLPSQSTGCYVDFKVEPRVYIPSATIMSTDVLKELLANLKRFERDVAQLQKDLVKLGELGELPLKFDASTNVIRVFFPNCDRARLEMLLMEKNVFGGVIHEDSLRLYDQIQDDELARSISEVDILSSSCNSMSQPLSGSMDDDYDEILSLSNASSRGIKLVDSEPVTVLSQVEFADDYHWV